MPWKKWNAATKMSIGQLPTTKIERQSNATKAMVVLKKYNRKKRFYAFGSISTMWDFFQYFALYFLQVFKTPIFLLLQFLFFYCVKNINVPTPFIQFLCSMSTPHSFNYSIIIHKIFKSVRCTVTISYFFYHVFCVNSSIVCWKKMLSHVYRKLFKKKTTFLTHTFIPSLS